jgi:hypothetical protein
MLDDFKKGVIESAVKPTVLHWFDCFVQTAANKQISDLENVFTSFLSKHQTFAKGGLSKAQALLYLDLIDIVIGTHPFKFDNNQNLEMQKKYKYIDLAVEYWRS